MIDWACIYKNRLIEKAVVYLFYLEKRVWLNGETNKALPIV